MEAPAWVHFLQEEAQKQIFQNSRGVCFPGWVGRKEPCREKPIGPSCLSSWIKESFRLFELSQTWPCDIFLFNNNKCTRGRPMMRNFPPWVACTQAEECTGRERKRFHDWIINKFNSGLQTWPTSKADVTKMKNGKRGTSRGDRKIKNGEQNLTWALALITGSLSNNDGDGYESVS